MVKAEIEKLEKLKSQNVDALWTELAEGITTEDAVRKLFEIRQSKGGGKVYNPWSGKWSDMPSPVKIKRIVKVVNHARLKAFKKAGGFQMNTNKAGQQHTDTLLFHGCAPAPATNIQAEGLLLKYVGKNGTMLGNGLYGAPDPRKSFTYATDEGFGSFLFICRFNLSAAKHAGPDTTHKNEVFHEYCVFNEKHVVVLWMIKVSKG
mmetsp:Transcript_39831/g.68312  ORF Transcript_39831/g.68312 Transcript_39831/m.68312 type:complete len:205 (-) Transcript_39831:287-901(-)